MRWIRTRWGHEVGIVEAAAILSICDDGITLSATAAKVVLLEVAGDLVETVTVEQVVNHVAGVEQLRDGGVDVLPRLSHRIGTLSLLRVVLEVEQKVLAAIVLLELSGGSVVRNPGVLSLPVLVCEDVVAPSRRRVVPSLG